MGPYLSHFFPKALDMTRSALEGTSDSDETDLDTTKHQSSAWVRLSVLRLIGVVPWSGINIACGVCGVAISDCMLGSFIGSLPWTAVTCQVCALVSRIYCYTKTLTPLSFTSDRRYPANRSIYTITNSADRVIPPHLPRNTRQTRLPVVPLLGAHSRQRAAAGLDIFRIVRITNAGFINIYHPS